MFEYAQKRQIKDAVRNGILQDHFATRQRNLLEAMDAGVEGREPDLEPTDMSSLGTILLDVRERTGFKFPAERDNDGDSR
jgi:hypothetical protein